jgi:AcrR family transcriptional regulator
MDGLRERKKAQTRQAITDAALTLFGERGFDAVPVAAVARAAGVSEATVFNYFPTKESLVFRGLEEFETALVSAIGARPAGTSVVAAFEEFVLGPPYGELGSDRLRTAARIIEGSPALLARERLIYDQYTDALAALLASDSRARDDLTAWVTANALLGVHRALVAYVRRETLAGVAGPTLVRRVRALGRRALALLASGIG